MAKKITYQDLLTEMAMQFGMSPDEGFTRITQIMRTAKDNGRSGHQYILPMANMAELMAKFLDQHINLEAAFRSKSIEQENKVIEHG